MKINPLSGAVRFLNRVDEKSDAGNQDGRQKKDSEDQSQKRKDEAAPQEVTADKLSEAVAGFQADSQAQANGLTASVEGSGPGLKVVLKDISGSVIRQFTGSEFLSIREGTSKEGPARGKILDQKL